MPLIEGVGDEVTQFFVVLLTAVLACIAWWTTRISEQRQLRTVFLIDRQARADRRRNRPALFHSEGVPTMSEAAQPEVEVEATAAPATLRKPPEQAGSSGVDEQTASSPEEQEQHIIVQAMDAPDTNPEEQEEHIFVHPMDASETNPEDQVEHIFVYPMDAPEANPEEQEEHIFVHPMDAPDTNVLRQRRTAFYTIHETLIDHSGDGEPAPSSDSSDGNDGDEDETYEGTPNAHGDFVLTAEYNNDADLATAQPNNGTPSTTDNADVGAAIKIKLKYINDELKLVEGRLEETIGEFKRRHFVVELNTNKVVRLIFNGRVLQPDESSLQNCGLFDNCVVHCLIHNKRPSVVDPNDASSNADDFMRRNNNNNNNNNRRRMPHMNNNNQGRESDLGNILLGLISFILGSAWYFRYVYAHLYTITATVALVAVTGIFSVVVIGMYFPDQEVGPQRRENE